MANEFIDCSSEVKKELEKLSKQALRAGGKIVTQIMKDDISSKHKHTGNLAKSVNATAFIDRTTGRPKLNIGYYTRKKMKKKYGVKYFVNPAWFEFGTKPHTIMTKSLKLSGKYTYKLNDGSHDYGYSVLNTGMKQTNLLRNTVYNNIEAIHQAEIEKLGQLTDLMIQNGAVIKDEEETEEDREDD